MLKINEIFYSIQGESTYNGMPCIFIRLTYCNLRCSYCDTEYSFYEGKDMSIEQIMDQIQKYECKLVEVTGGEPLMQEEAIDLMQTLIEKKYSVMLETGGSLPISKVPKEVIKIIERKTTEFIGTIEDSKGFAFLIPKNKKIFVDFFIIASPKL